MSPFWIKCVTKTTDYGKLYQMSWKFLFLNQSHGNIYIWLIKYHFGMSMEREIRALFSRASSFERSAPEQLNVTSKLFLTKWACVVIRFACWTRPWLIHDQIFHEVQCPYLLKFEDIVLGVEVTTDQIIKLRIRRRVFTKPLVDVHAKYELLSLW